MQVKELQRYRVKFEGTKVVIGRMDADSHFRHHQRLLRTLRKR